MRDSEEKRTNCPHCGELYYPLWTEKDIEAPRPNRKTEINVGRIWATTCTSCDRPIVEIRVLREDETFIMHGDTDSDRVFPVEPEWVIEIIIQVFIDFENLRRQQEGEPEMTDEEKSDRHGSLHEFFSRIWETVRTGSDAMQVVNKYLPFFEQLTKLLPPSSSS